ncbi:MAG: hypothetical protein HeimC3_39860 [Candidatus Heimdallarchaeota archaeon LC_3]|nr:MAG: hypothetical protein HeimC3_39860 [Candidatus Heimdallarchaeota archaeon LC_3]
MSKKEKQSGDLKEIILTTIDKYPGLSLRELSRELDISSSLMKYHIDSLNNEHKIVGVRDQKAIRFFLTDQQISEEEFKTLKLLRNPVILEFIVLFLESFEGDDPNTLRGILRNNDLYKKLRFNSKGTISYYLKKLLEEKIIIKVADMSNSYQLQDRDKIKGLILLYKPNPSVIASFSSLWSNFYKRK